MEAEKRLDASLLLYKQQMEHYHKTQEVEWKGTFGAWALAAAAVGLTFQNSPVVVGAWSWMILLLPIFHIGWLWRIHGSEEFDKRLWTDYRNAACELAELPKTTSKERTVVSEVFWIAVEAGPTAALAMLFMGRVSG